MPKRESPTFIIIGAAKAGTTALHAYLAQHPDVFMSPVKETNFFAWPELDAERASTTDPANRRHLSRMRAGAIRTPEAYRRLFAPAGRFAAAGEASPSYMASPRAAGRIAAALPDVRIVAILRDPAERALSHYYHFRRQGLETRESFMEAVRSGDWRAGHYIRGGLYRHKLEPYLRLFPRERVRLLLYDDFSADPVGTLQRLFEWLGVRRDFVPNVARKVNVSGVPRNRMLETAFRATGRGPGRTLARMLPDGVKARLRVLRERNLDRRRLTAEERAVLIPHFEDEVRALEQLLDRDLGAWRQ